MVDTATPLNFPYQAIDLTMNINDLPNNYGLINQLGLFGASLPVSTTFVRLDVENESLRILPSTARGGPATRARRARDDAHLFKIPHFPYDDEVDPSDIQDLLRAQGTELVGATAEDWIERRLAGMRNHHDIVLEYMRMGALKGKILDGAGTEIHDLYAVLGKTQKTVYFNFASDTSAIRTHCDEVLEHMSENLRGETMIGAQALVDPGFFNGLVEHPKVADLYQGYEAAQALANPNYRFAGGMYGRQFPFGGILWTEYKGSWTLADGSPEKIVGADTAYVFPTGTTNTFATHHAPPNAMSWVNSLGPEIFVSPEPKKHDAGVELHSESNRLALVKRPALVIKCSAGADPG